MSSVTRDRAVLKLLNYKLKFIIQCICKRERGDMEKFETRVLHWSKVEHSYATVLLKRIPD